MTSDVWSCRCGGEPENRCDRQPTAIHSRQRKERAMGYRIATERRGAQEIFLLHDDTTGASAAVLPSHGFNLFDLRLPAAGEPRPMVYAADDFAENPRHGAGNGVPLLFPFPNRIGQAAFTFQGRTYSLPANNGPNAIHGFAVDAP